MKCGVRFCGGCNPRYDRGNAYEQIKKTLETAVQTDIAREGESYDTLLVIGGCTNCCASYKQFTFEQPVLKMWSEEHIENIINEIKKRTLCV